MHSFPDSRSEPKIHAGHPWPSLYLPNSCRARCIADFTPLQAGLIAGEEIPGVTPLAIVFAHRSPLSLTDVRPPLPPVGRALAGFLQARLFLCHYGLRSRFVDTLSPSRNFARSAQRNWQLIQAAGVRTKH